MSTTVQRKSRRLRRRVAVFACLVLIATGLDQVTKALAQVRLTEGRAEVLIPKVLSLRLLRNPGASLGLGSDYTWLISLVAVVACVAFIILFVSTDSMAWTIAFALAFSGAVGNLIDRVVYAHGFLDGRVVDFIDYGWSVGNVADIYLTMAALLIIVLIMMGKPFKATVQDTKTDLVTEAADFQEVVL
ncbi:signal peptidase II [Bombiscardovia coagulans]|uniref:Lipoprotein signal peptidase n=1 Tax=Bombiscardovia coagulans TaxID=686666 RepID=A0A261EPA6_9BIFI|nr:signal peptidase II [Bombiscardovia coagulans]OZG48687.1 lipoprotein signal peptidase [Bombiscardovia coagulans]